MEPDGLNELRYYLTKKLQQKVADSNTDEELDECIDDYLNCLATVGSLTGSGHGSAHYWLEQNEVQEYTWDDYNEEIQDEIEDKDLGLVRKINLN